MTQEITSKNIDGITDLVVVAPIKEGFIEAYENITYTTRLKLVAEALNRVRVAAREHERITPFSDVTERILTLLDFRVGIIDKDLFSLRVAKEDVGKAWGKPKKMEMESRRYLYLTATFDGAWEPYMRLIWNPLGPFLDLLFCNCDGYVTATDHSFDEYAQWVRDNQMDSAIFYATTGLTIRDHLYLSKLERLQRGGRSDLDLAETTMDYPEVKAAGTRNGPLHARRKTVELALEALTVLYKLADYYPPQWLTGNDGDLKNLNEGHRLAQVARDLLKGLDEVIAQLDQLAQSNPPAGPLKDAKDRWILARQIYAEPLLWYETGRVELEKREDQKVRARRPDPPFDREQVQGGILKAQGAKDTPVQFGALLLFTIRDAAAARLFLKALPVNFANGDGADGIDGLYHTVGFTHDGLLRLGVDRNVAERFPKEFREGMAMRSGLFGDMRENHPRNWILPERNGPVITGAVPGDRRLPPVEMSEVDFVIQIRSTNSAEPALVDEVKRLAELAGSGASLEAVEWLQSGYDAASGLFKDHFGYTDGLSQPKPDLQDDPATGDRDRVAPGEILLGYGNDRMDSAPGDFSDPEDWRNASRNDARELQKNGTFLVLRKIGEEVDRFEQWLGAKVAEINAAHPLKTAMTVDRLKALILGRNVDGAPLLPAPNSPNDFDYKNDVKGEGCPFASHIRRANPRKVEFERPNPRLIRRGMRFDRTDAAGTRQRGIMFMAYNASIAEQYETIQRWLNGGNSTDIASAHNDPLTGVQPKDGAGVFRFIEQGTDGPIAISVTLPPFTPGPEPTGGSEPGRHPFTPLHWGLYLFVPSRSGLKLLKEQEGDYEILGKPLEEAVGQEIVNRLDALTDEVAGMEWKRLLEDFDSKDPAQRDLSPNMWATIRWNYKGAFNLNQAIPLVDYNWKHPNYEKQNVILVAGRTQVRQVLAEWDKFSTEEQLRRIAPNSGPIFVTQQPDNDYQNADLNGKGLDYPSESKDTNKILLEYDEAAGFYAGYAAGVAVLQKAKVAVGDRKSFKMELRRQYLLPALGALCKIWYGLPDDKHMLLKGWTWEKIVEAGAAEAIDEQNHKLTRTTAHCPGDFLSPSRNAFYPRPSKAVGAFAESHGTAILKAAEEFVKEHRAPGVPPTGTVAARMFSAIPYNDALLARNLIGTMVGAIPPMDGNLRGILLEWLGEKSLWRHQAALHAALRGQRADTDFAKARAVLYEPVSQAMCKRPAPDLIYRTAKGPSEIKLGSRHDTEPRGVVTAKDGDLVVVSQVSASQRSLLKIRGSDGKGDVSIVFGGNRDAPAQGYKMDGDKAIPDPDADNRFPVHACPAQNMAMGAIMGIMAALLDAGTIQALPASLIVKISDWDTLPA